jgi:hypothetical protein
MVLCRLQVCLTRHVDSKPLPTTKTLIPVALSSMPPSFDRKLRKTRLQTPEWQGNTLPQPGSAPAEMPIEIPAKAVYNENL